MGLTRPLIDDPNTDRETRELLATRATIDAVSGGWAVTEAGRGG